MNAAKRRVLPHRQTMAALIKQTALDAMARDQSPWLEIADLVRSMMDGSHVSVQDPGPATRWQDVGVEALGLPPAAVNALIRAGLTTAGMVDEADDAQLLRQDNLGYGSLGRIRDAIRRLDGFQAGDERHRVER